MKRSDYPAGLRCLGRWFCSIARRSVAPIATPERGNRSLAPPQGAPGPGQEERERELERLRQELSGCRVANRQLFALYSTVASRHAALNFRSYELSQDNQTLQFHIAGLRGDQGYLRRDVERLRAEVDALRRAIASCHSETDCCRPFRDAFQHRAPPPVGDTRNVRDSDDGLDDSSASVCHAEE